MEIGIAVFLGLWLSMSSILAYAQLKKDYQEQDGEEGKRQ